MRGENRADCQSLLVSLLQALAHPDYILSEGVVIARHHSLNMHQRFHLCRRIVLAYLNHGARLLSEKKKSCLHAVQKAKEILNRHMVRSHASAAQCLMLRLRWGT